MVNFLKFSVAMAVAAFAGSSVAHPGEKYDMKEVARQVNARNYMAAAAKRSLNGCSSSSKHRSLERRNVARRSATARSLRKKMGITSSMFSGHGCETLNLTWY